MPQKAKSPPASTGRAPNALLSWRAESGSEITKQPTNFQPISVVADAIVTDLPTRRVAWLARRYRLTPTMAQLVAAFCFDGVAR